MTTTSELVARLVDDGVPVRRLPSPLGRAAKWLAVAAMVVALVFALHGLRPDLALCLTRPTYLVGLAASLATCALAALAAFLVSQPDRSRVWLLLPAPSLLLWLSTVTYGCLTDWVAYDAAREVRLGVTAGCFLLIVATSLPLGGTLIWMLRHTASLRPLDSALAVATSVGALTAAVVQLAHPYAASLLVVLWNFGTVALVVALDVPMARRLFAARRYFPEPRA